MREDRMTVRLSMSFDELMGIDDIGLPTSSATVLGATRLTRAQSTSRTAQRRPEG
jgi:hypothetical protein